MISSTTSSSSSHPSATSHRGHASPSPSPARDHRSSASPTFSNLRLAEWGARSSSPERKRHRDLFRPSGLGRLRLRTPIVFLLLTIATVAYKLSHPSKLHDVFRPTSHKLSAQRRATRDVPFVPSADPRPVQHLERIMDYSNNPLSIHRPPANQFTLSPSAHFDRPVVALIMATNNPRTVIRETATSLFGQSLQNFIWIIVDDHTTSAESIELISVIAKDPRVVVLHNQGPKGLAQGRNVALKWIFEQSYVPPFLVSLDDDDLFEFTALEKTTWLLESNADWDLAGYPYVKFGSANETVTTGIHSGSDNFVYGNFVPNAAVYRSSAVLKSGCRYDEEHFHEGGEDWDFWMCLAAAGHWGGSVPEPLYWYRMNPVAFRSSRWGSTFIDGFGELKKKIHAKRPEFRTAADFPTRAPRQSRPLEAISWKAPYDSNLAHHAKAIMIALPWLYVGGADIGALHMVQLYAELGYRVTVLCTLYQFPDGIELRPQVLQWTHDVHIMPSFLRANDFPRYIKHLIDSRGIQQVLFSNSQLMYEILPALVEQVPHVQFIDYLHNEAYDGWKSGGYPTYSVISQRYLARTLTCSEYLKDWLVERGHDPSRIGVVKLGIEIDDFLPVREQARADAKDALFDVEPDTLVVTVVGRLDPQKRPTLVPLIINEIIKLVADQDFLVVMLGDGPLKRRVTDRIEEFQVEDFIRTVGTVSRPQDYLVGSDIFLLPSLSEGISIAVAEAMAMGLPIITSHAGALPEQLGVGTDHVGGILVNHTLNEDTDAKLYATEIVRLFNDPKARRRYGEAARRNVETSFDWHKTLARLPEELALARNHAGHGVIPPHGLANPAAYLAIQTLLLEAWGETDMKAAYGRYS